MDAATMTVATDIKVFRARKASTLFTTSSRVGRCAEHAKASRPRKIAATGTVPVPKPSSATSPAAAPKTSHFAPSLLVIGLAC